MNAILKNLKLDDHSEKFIFLQKSILFNIKLKCCHIAKFVISQQKKAFDFTT